MEHRNSTCIVQTVAEKLRAMRSGCWALSRTNIFKQLERETHSSCKSLEPFNFEHADMSSGIVVPAEGLTQYYGELLLVRAGLHNPEEYTQAL